MTDGGDGSHSFDTVPMQVDRVKSNSPDENIIIDILPDYQELRGGYGSSQRPQTRAAIQDQLWI